MRAAIIDTETTGIDPTKDKLVEVAGIDLDTNTSFSTLCDPEMPIPAEAMAIHHITDEMVKGAMHPCEALTELWHHLPADYYVAHNAPFDRGMIEAEAPDYPPRWIDTYQCAVHIFPDAPKHTNQVLRYHLLLGSQPPGDLAPHRALYDCYVTRDLLIRLLDHASLEELAELSTKPALLNRVSFGKHQGMLWSEVPYGYLKWCSQQDMGMNIAHTVAAYMKKPSWSR